MAMTKDDVRAAFRQAMALEFAGIPQEEEIDHTFSPAFCARMDALIAEQRRGSFRLLSRNKRRALVIAALLAAMLLLTGFTPAGQQLTQLTANFFREFVFFSHAVPLKPTIEEEYTVGCLPDSFVLVDEECPNDIFRAKHFSDGKDTIILSQFAGDHASGSTDSENGSVFLKTINGTEVLLALYPEGAFAMWTQDGYYFILDFLGIVSQETMEEFVKSVSPIT